MKTDIIERQKPGRSKAEKHVPFPIKFQLIQNRAISQFIIHFSFSLSPPLVEATIEPNIPLHAHNTAFDFVFFPSPETLRLCWCRASRAHFQDDSLGIREMEENKMNSSKKW
jgi:hypothetical protein